MLMVAVFYATLVYHLYGDQVRPRPALCASCCRLLPPRLPLPLLLRALVCCTERMRISGCGQAGVDACLSRWWTFALLINNYMVCDCLGHAW